MAQNDTKPCKLRWFWAVYASKWPQNTVNASVLMCFQLLLSSRVASNHAICRFFVAERAFAVVWHKATVLTRASAPSCHKTLYIGMASSYVRFKVTTKHRKCH